MLDQSQAGPHETPYWYADAQQVEAPTTHVSIRQRPGLYEAQDDLEEMLLEEGTSHVQSDSLAARTPSIHNVPIGQQYRTDRYTGPEGGGYDLAADGEFPGFWKPNRLY